MDFAFRIIFCLLIGWHANSFYCYGDVRVSIFNGHSVSAVIISPDKGEFNVVADGKLLFVMKENDLLYASIKGDGLFVGNMSGSPGIFESLSVYSSSPGNGFSIRPVQPSLEKMHYYGNLDLSVSYERISMINVAEEKLYLAGVVEAETGTGAAPMFYQAQSVICRTYLYGNLHRHAGEGFDLCDEVHCQVYHGRLTGNQVIGDAVNATAGKVLVSKEGELITAAFHANCGGQTAGSEEVWLINRPYLQPVKDSFCRTRPGASWSVIIDREQWITYLTGMGFEEDRIRSNLFDFTAQQKTRKAYYRLGDFSLPYRKIRSDWNLRSSFFDIENSGRGQLIFRGRGYGHGAGLCQEGAMEMAAGGYNFMEILQFYYTGITIIDVDRLF